MCICRHEFVFQITSEALVCLGIQMKTIGLNWSPFRRDYYSCKSWQTDGVGLGLVSSHLLESAVQVQSRNVPNYARPSQTHNTCLTYVLLYFVNSFRKFIQPLFKNPNQGRYQYIFGFERNDLSDLYKRGKLFL